MALRVTQQFAEFATGDVESSDLRVTTQFVDVVAAGAEFDPDLRLTTQWIDVVATGVDFAPDLRVATQWVEVCVQHYYRGFTSQLGTLKSSLAGSTLIPGRPLGLPAEIQPVPPSYEAPDPAYTGMLATFNSLLGLTLQLGAEAVIEPELFGDASDVLNMSEVATPQAAYLRSAADTLTVTDAAARVFEVSVSDSLILIETLTQAISRVATDELAFSEVATGVVITVYAASDTLVFDAEEAAVASTYNREASDTFTFSEDEAVSSQVARRSNYDTLLLTEVAEGARVISVLDTFTLSDEASAAVAPHVQDTLTLTDEATYSGVFDRRAGDYFVLGEDASGAHTIEVTAEDSFTLAENFTAVACKAAGDTLTVTDAAVGVQSTVAKDTLSLSDEATHTAVFHRSTWDSLVLSDEVIHTGEHYVVATDAISFIERASTVLNVVEELALGEVAVAWAGRGVTDTLQLTDEAFGETTRKWCSDEVALGEVASCYAVRYQYANDNLSRITETAWPGLHYASATDSLQDIYVGYDPETYEEILTIVGLDDSAEAAVNHTAPYEIDELLPLTELATGVKQSADAIPCVASDSLSLSESLNRAYLGDGLDSLELTDTAEAFICKPASDDELSLTEEARCNVSVTRAASDSLELGEAVLYYNAIEDFLCVYHPFVGGGSGDLPDPPSETLPEIVPGITDRFKLVYPTSGPFSDTLVLRAPNLGNRHRLQMNRISRETRGGTLIVFADPMWPKIQTLVLDFSGLSWAEASGLHTFMDAHLGLEIGVLDWEHRFWQGVITKQDDPIVQDGPGCKYTAGFEFEGELATYDPGP